MALVTVIAVNQGGSPLSFTQLLVPNGQIAGGSQYQLTDSNYVEQILRDEELQGYIQTDDILLTVNGIVLTKEQSLAFLDAPTESVKNSLGVSSTAPTVNDDESTGYSIGSVWVTTAGALYICVDASDGAAVWSFPVTVQGGVQGDVLYYNGSAWTRLAAGTDGQFLQTQGAGANPQWADAGAATDHATLTNLGWTVSGHTGTAGSLAAFDGTGATSFVTGATQGDILYFNGTVWTVLTPGTSGYILQTNGPGANPSWVANPGGTDELVKVTSADTTAGYLNDKLTSGVGALTFTVVNPGGEDLRLDIANATYTADGLESATDKHWSNHAFDSGWAEAGDLTYNAGL